MINKAQLNTTTMIIKGGSMTAEELQDKINAIESKYYKGWKQSEEWWQITGNVDPSDRELWIKYNELKRRKHDNTTKNKKYCRRYYCR